MLNLAKDFLTIFINPMQRKEIKLLAINPGTKYIGLAVFQGQDLTYWGIKTFKGNWSKEKMIRIKTTLLNLIAQYGITKLILKKLNQTNSSVNLNDLTEAIEKLAREKRLKVSLYRLGDIKKILMEDGRINKMDVARLVANRYPFLNCHLEKERRNKNEYFVRMFEAIAAGIFSISRFNP
jgi:RNase H-fold protein (predicted Holliday junction resolvase)